MRRTLELRIPSEMGWERSAMEFAGSVAHISGFSAEQVDDVKTAVLEATLNAIEHGNGLDANRSVSIRITPREQQLEIVVQDRSRIAWTIPDSPPSLADQIAGRAAPRGWGIFLIRSLV